MLFGEEAVSIIIKCPLCKNILKDAKILPYGVYCMSCVKELTYYADETTKEFECNSYRIIHIIPENCFMKWNSFEGFIQVII